MSYIQVKTSDRKVREDNELKQNKHYKSGTYLFLSFFWSRPFLIGFAITMNLLSALMRTLPAVYIGKALDSLDQKGFQEEFIGLCLIIVLLGILFLVVTFSAAYSFLTSSFSFERDIRQEFFDVIQNHSLTFHDEQNSSKLLSMGMTEIEQMRRGVFPSIFHMANVFFSSFLTIWFLFEINSDYSLVFLVGFVIYLYLAYRYSRKIIPVRIDLANTVGELTEASQEIFRGIEVVRGNSADLREKNRFFNKNRTYSHLAEKEGKLQAFYLPGLILLAVTVIIFGMGLIDVSNSEITIGQLVGGVALLLALQRLNFMVPMSLLNIQAALINSDRIWRILNWKDPQPEKEYESIPSVNWNSILEFNSVSFSYNSTKYALKDLTVEIPPGSEVAVIGGPGSGKSTLLKLLLRLYDPQYGNILIDDKNFIDIPPAIIRKHISRVEQDVFLFSASVKDNIAYSNSNATENEILTAAKAAQAHEFIIALPNGYDTIIGERGVDLSGGQRQRLAIARALLMDPDILLLDDEVSAVDAKTELLLRKALANLRKGRTAITITQRLNSLTRADIIIVLDKGEALAIGKHEELLDSCPEYKRIFELLPESERIERTSEEHKGGGKL